MADSHDNAKNMVKGVLINGDFMGNNLETRTELQKIILKKVQITTANPPPSLLFRVFECQI